MVFRSCIVRSRRVFNIFWSRDHSSTMAASTTHMEKTADHKRSTVATVSSVTSITPSVKLVRIQVNDLCTFKAGQWVDLFLPGVDIVGGYSICSAPQTLLSQGTLDLAVKLSNHPPAKWIHSQCRHGARVSFRIGGDFYYDAQELAGYSHLLLIAGGVGINPLCSMFREIASEKDAGHGSTQHLKVSLLYSACSVADLQFTDVFDEASKKFPSMQCRYFVTGQSSNNASIVGKSISRGRISIDALSEELHGTNLNGSCAFICGPPSMIESMESFLKTLGLPQTNVRKEKWW